jgi:DNA adenine methylase
MNENVSAWLSAVDGLPEARERLKRIEIRNMDAGEFIRKYDHEAAVFYCDPPYMPITRTATNAYACEMTEEDHEKLLKTLTHLKGRFLLSGYETDLYNNFANNCGWHVHRKESPNHASSKLSKRLMTECLWTNYP